MQTKTVSPQSEWNGNKSSRKQTTTNAGENAGLGENPYTLLVGM
jgi:hypothetical protein